MLRSKMGSISRINLANVHHSIRIITQAKTAATRELLLAGAKHHAEQCEQNKYPSPTAHIHYQSTVSMILKGKDNR